MLIGTSVWRSPRSCVKNKVITSVLLSIFCSIYFFIEAAGIGVNRNTEGIQTNLTIARTKSKLSVGIGKAATVLGKLGFKAGKNEHFPIPDSQRKLNPTLPASPGYTY